MLLNIMLNSVVLSTVLYGVSFFTDFGWDSTSFKIVLIFFLFKKLYKNFHILALMPSLIHWKTIDLLGTMSHAALKSFMMETVHRFFLKAVFFYQYITKHPQYFF